MISRARMPMAEAVPELSSLLLLFCGIAVSWAFFFSGLCFGVYLWRLGVRLFYIRVCIDDDDDTGGMDLVYYFILSTGLQLALL